MKFISILLGAVFCLILILSLRNDVTFRVVGYVHSFNRVPDLSRIQFKKITHLNIAFVNPDSSGNLKLLAGFDSIITTAHNNNVKVLASIGGGSHNPYYAKLLSDSGRSFFIERLVKLSIDHKLDGIDIDLENDAIDSNYTPFVISLSLKLRLNNKLMTAAFATWNANLISDSALEKFDFINIMSYDETGPWRPERAGQHSPFSKAENDIRNWRETRHLPKEKINLGLPFYAYCFNTKYGASMSFESIVKTFPGSQVKDSIVPEGGGLIYYNGLPTIRKKTELAFANTGGVMIWQLLQDSPGEHSLLSAIDETHRSEK